MIYGSVCSGIEAATVAWHPLGWRPAFFSDIEKFPCAVLKHHYPDVPLHGDFTTIGADEYGPIDLLVGGTPCQDFSVAGLRKGISGDRGNLTLEYVRLAQRKKPRWILWENVPGVLSSDGGGAFGSLLGGLGELGYGFAYRVLDAQYFGVPQRRRRVFVVGYLGDWRPAAAVLFERESLRGDITPCREAGKSVAGTIAKCSFSGGSGGRPEGAAAGHFIESFGIDYEHNAHDIDDATGPLLKGSPSGGGHQLPAVMVPDTAWCLQERDAKGPDSDTKDGHLIPTRTKVRRLTPRECERLQGFPDDYTLLPGNKADGPRYKALGNSMAVPCMRWLGERIDKVDRLL